MTFAAHAPPSWVGADGFPLSWRHYVYGMAFISREYLRRQLEQAQAARMASAEKEDYQSWQRDVETVTGVPR